ncbi:MAG: VWA domain-containing protein [Phycisphaeraceae bacterium]
MKYKYGEYDGEPFPTPDSLFPTPQVVRFILQYGQQALDALENNEDEQYAQMVQEMLDAGLLERDERTGELRLTPRMVKGIEHRSLLEIFAGLRQGTKEGHATLDAGRGDERTDGTKPYEFGDPISELDVHATMRNALARQMGNVEQESNQQPHSSPTLPQPLPKREGSRAPIHLNSGDFELFQTEGHSDVAMCILLDMSGSMMRYGRFFQAKRVALGMAGLMRRHFPQDTIDYVGFYSTACRIRESELPLIMPKPVSMYDPVIRLRVPLQQAMDNPRRVPQHFTNLQLGLRMARQILSRRGAANKQIFVITDGQPTAHVEPGPTGDDMLYLLYPPSDQTCTITLKEALRCQQQGIRLSTFALIEDYWGMDWVGFVDQLTRLTRGTAFYCSSDDLSSTVVESYLSGKKQKKAMM